MDQDFYSKTNSCAGIPSDDADLLEEAARRACDARGLGMALIETLGDRIALVGGNTSSLLKEKFGVDVSAKLEGTTQDILWQFQNGAMIGLDSDGTGDRWEWLHKALVVVSGASGGFVGLPGLLWDLPITTMTIMRSVADIARGFQAEDLNSDDTKRACIEVFAFGGPFDDEDGADLGYLAARTGLTHATIEVFIRAVASRFSIVISEKLLAQAVPVIGSAAGAWINYVFIDYYQEMARVQFMIRDIERRAPDPSAVRPCFAAIAREIRAGRSGRAAKPLGGPQTISAG